MIGAYDNGYLIMKHTFHQKFHRQTTPEVNSCVLLQKKTHPEQSRGPRLGEQSRWEIFPFFPELLQCFSPITQIIKYQREYTLCVLFY